MKKIGFLAGLCGALLGLGGVRADIVYTTSTTSGAASNTNNVGTTGLPNSAGLLLGTFGGGNVFTKSANSAVVRFTVAGSNVVFSGIGINLFLDEAGGPSSPMQIDTGTITWRLYSGTSLTQVGTDVTQAIANVGHNGAGQGINSYQGSSFSSAFNLTAGQYTLELRSLTGTSTSNLNGDDVHWTYTLGSTAAGGAYSVQGAGFTTGAYTGGSQVINATGGAIAFDLVAVPEPGTMALGAIASVAGVGGWWSRRKKKVAEVKEEVVA